MTDRQFLAHVKRRYGYAIRGAFTLSLDRADREQLLAAVAEAIEAEWVCLKAKVQ